MNKGKSVLLAAGVSLAMALTSCGGSKPPAASGAAVDDGDGFSDVSSITDNMLMKCQNEFRDHFCGVGEGVSTKSGSAGDIAGANAARNLVLEVERGIKSTLANSYSVDPNDQDVSSTLSQTVQKAQGTFNNITIRDSKTQFNKQDGKYRVYRLLSVPKNDVYKSMKNTMSANQAMQSTATAVVITEMINKELEKLSQ